MVKIFLDTNSLLLYLLGNESIIEKVKQYIGREELCISSLTYLEVSLSIKDDRIVEEIGNSFTIAEINKEVMEKAKELYLYIEERGKPSIREVITAATCIVNKGFLIPGSKKDYLDFPEIKLI